MRWWMQRRRRAKDRQEVASLFAETFIIFESSHPE
jgi:hypothetical protein